MTGFDHLESGWNSQCGLRPCNEDAVIHLPHWGVFGVCDGMGGLAQGGEASRLVVSHVEQQFRQSLFPTALNGLAFRLLAIHMALERAAAEMRERTRTRGLPGMGSTIAVLVMPACGERVRPAVLHAGDSLVFRLREDTFKCLCTPHTVESQFGAAAHCLTRRERRSLTRAVDHQCDTRVEVTYVDLGPGDTALICTDGVSSVLNTEPMGQTLYDHGTEPPTAMAEALTQAALDAGGRDNATAVVVRNLSE